MIDISVRFYATLRKYVPGTGIGELLLLQMEAGASLADLLAWLGVPQEGMKTAFVNNRRQEGGYLLQGGGRVALLRRT